MKLISKKLFEVICQIVFAIAMFITAIYGFHHNMYSECIITAILGILFTRNIPNRIKEYKKNL